MKKTAALLLILLYSAPTWACSTFLLSKNGHHVFGRNYDWVSGNGMVMVNARGVRKTSFGPPGQKSISWVSGCGSITFNQFGKEFPHGGMNEKGLVVELMWLAGTAYPEADDRAALNELQWIQYQLDNCSSVEEVIATDRQVRISRAGAAAPLHYLVADAQGNAATIEFVSGRMVVHRGADLAQPVLTNTVYADALRQYRAGRQAGTAQSGDNSVDRFATACRMVQQYRQAEGGRPPVEEAFHILDAVAQGDYTRWRIVYDITARRVHFTTLDRRQRKQVSFADFDFSCSQPPLAFHLDRSEGGGVARYFTPLLAGQNRSLIERSARESRGQLSIPPAVIDGAAAYFGSLHCNQ